MKIVNNILLTGLLAFVSSYAIPVIVNIDVEKFAQVLEHDAKTADDKAEGIGKQVQASINTSERTKLISDFNKLLDDLNERYAQLEQNIQEISQSGTTGYQIPPIKKLNDLLASIRNDIDIAHQKFGRATLQQSVQSFTGRTGLGGGPIVGPVRTQPAPFFDRPEMQKVSPGGMLPR